MNIMAILQKALLHRMHFGSLSSRCSKSKRPIAAFTACNDVTSLFISDNRPLLSSRIPEINLDMFQNQCQRYVGRNYRTVG